MAQLLLECHSFRDGQTRTAIVASAADAHKTAITRSSNECDDALAIVRGFLKIDGGLSRLLQRVRYYEEGSTGWTELLWRLVELREPALGIDRLKELAKIMHFADISNNSRVLVFDRIAAKFPDVRFEVPNSWQDAIVLLADYTAEKMPAPLLLAQALGVQCELSTRHRLDKWLREAAKAAGLNSVRVRRNYPAKASAGKVVLTFEIWRGDVEPDKGYSASAFLSNGVSFENMGGGEYEDEKKLKLWVAGQLRDPRLAQRKPVLEFMLSDDLLSLDVDRWPVVPEEEDSLPLGLVYPLVIRSRWRLRDPIAAQFSEDWHHWWSRLRKNGCGMMRWVETPQGSEPNALYAELRNGKHCSVGFGFPSKSKPALSLFGRALRAGAPVLIWTRRDTGARVEDERELRSLVTGKLEDLPTKLLGKRLDAARAGGNDSGFYVSLLRDDPKRLLDGGREHLLTNEQLR
jgi:hypothetical protein